jgi:hypothetical protein
VKYRFLVFLLPTVAAFILMPDVVVADWSREPPGDASLPSRPVGLTIDAQGKSWVATDSLEIHSGSRDKTRIPDPDATGGVVIASDSPGAVIVAWRGSLQGAGTLALARHTQAGWAGRVELERIAGPESAWPNALAMAAGPSRSVLAWLATPPGASAPVIRAAWRDAGQEWTTPTTIATTAVDRPIVGIDRAGNALVVWRSSDRRQIVGVRLAAGAPAWSNAEEISRAEAAPPVLAVGPDGDAVVAWSRPGRRGIMAVVGRLSLPGPLGTPSVVYLNGRRVGVAVGPGGRAAIVSADGRRFVVRSRDKRGRFDAARPIAPVPRSSAGIVPPGGYLPRIVIDRTGMTAVWARDYISDGDWGWTELMERRRTRGHWSRARVVDSISECCAGKITLESIDVVASARGHIAAVVGEYEDDDRGEEPYRASSHTLFEYSP